MEAVKYDSDSNLKKKLLAKNHLIFPSEVKNNKVTFEINDSNIINIYKPCIHMKMFEIKGEGLVAYKKDFPAHSILNYKITLVNPESTNVYIELSGHELNESLNYINGINSKYQSCYDKYCEEKRGHDIDDIIFEKFEMIIPLYIPNLNLCIFPETVVIIEIEFNKFVNLLTYNIEYGEKSLTHLINETCNLSRDYAISFMSDYNIKRKDKSYPYTIKTINQSDVNAEFFTSPKFDNTNEIIIYSKTKHFETENRFLFNPGSDLQDKTIIDKFINNFKDDLLYFVHGKDQMKLYNKEIQYVKVEDGYAHLTKNKKCKIIIHNLPEDVTVYFHSNILSYERRNDEKQKLNVSHLFRKIEGFYTETKFIYLDIVHDIDVTCASFPVEFWTHKTNTSTKDLRSKTSKKKDFFYSNSFLTGIDFSSRRLLIKRVETKIYNDNYKFVPPINYINKNPLRCEKKDSAYFNLELCLHPVSIQNDPKNGLVQFFIEIEWENRNSMPSIFNLIEPYIICEIIEFRKLEYVNDSVEIISNFN